VNPGVFSYGHSLGLPHLYVLEPNEQPFAGMDLKSDVPLPATQTDRPEPSQTVWLGATICVTLSDTDPAHPAPSISI